MKNNKLLFKKCPFCGSRFIGRLTYKSYYCSNCEHEIYLETPFLKICNILPDGKTTVIKKLKYCG